MRKSIANLLVVLLFASVPVSAQEISDQIPTPTVRVNTRLVVLDVIVTDKAGKPVTNLKPTDFTIEENGKKQKVSVFTLQQASVSSQRPLPPDVYSNRPQDSGALTILLIDALNTPVQNQMYARHMMLRYAGSQLQPGQRAAVYALGNNLIRLQDFTSDPQLLLDAIQKFVPVDLPATARSNAQGATVSTAIAVSTPQNPQAARGSGPLPRPGGARGEDPVGVRAALGPQSNAGVLAALQRFGQEELPTALQVRISSTLSALRALANSLAGHPGRKNLVWVSASFPFSPIPEDLTPVSQFNRAADPTAPPPLPNEIGSVAVASQIHNMYNDQVRRTTTLLSDSQIAVYPVDARGLFGSMITDATSSGLNAAGLLTMGHEFGTTVAGSNSALVASQNTMKDFARDTGGKAFINRNDIDNAIGIAATDGGTYYEIGYYPERKKFDGSFRKLKVTVAQPNLSIRHRSGYFAFDVTKMSPKERQASLAFAISSDAPASLILFDAQVVPPAPAAKAAVPVRFLVPSSSFTAEDAGDGKRHINLDFYAVAFGPDGRTVSNVGQTVDATLEADQFAQVEQQGLLLPMEVSLGPGEYNLRLAVRDNRTGYVGTVNVPLTLAKPTS